jgi:hypothetical protein
MMAKFPAAAQGSDTLSSLQAEVSKYRDAMNTVDEQMRNPPVARTVDFDAFEKILGAELTGNFRNFYSTHDFPTYATPNIAEGEKVFTDIVADVADTTAACRADIGKLEGMLADVQAERAALDTTTIKDVLDKHPEWKAEIIKDIDEDGNWF